mgnify:CR=1 FL=1
MDISTIKKINEKFQFLTKYCHIHPNHSMKLLDIIVITLSLLLLVDGINGELKTIILNIWYYKMDLLCAMIIIYILYRKGIHNNRV